jgi:adenosylcobyric acid synthase
VGEIGSAQYFQALAANSEPSVQMNPVLLKPEADSKSQVILLGKVDAELGAVAWRERSERVWPSITRSLDYLMSNNDVVIIEGAGSPAEINLMSSDIVNMRIAQYARAKCLMVVDIDRGGAFAHLYGTWSLLGPDNQSYISGFILNKFRGDERLLSPGPEMLEKLTGVPVVATVPMLRGHGLPEEDGVFDDREISRGELFLKIAIVVYPHISNLDEFQPLKNIASVSVVWARTPEELQEVDWIILPGSKQTSSDLYWLRSQGFEAPIRKHALKGRAILGICGGLQMLGSVLDDPVGVDGSAVGLNLLPIATIFESDKTLKRVNVTFPSFDGCWRSLSSLNINGYEIHHGQTRPMLLGAHETELTELIPEIAWINSQNNILGVYLHGIFENPNVLQTFFGKTSDSLDQVFDRLALHLKNSIKTGDNFFINLIR